MKTRSSKRRKNDIFLKGLVNGFGVKLAIFLLFSFKAVQARKMCSIIFLKQKTNFLGYKNKKFKNSKN